MTKVKILGITLVFCLLASVCIPLVSAFEEPKTGSPIGKFYFPWEQRPVQIHSEYYVEGEKVDINPNARHVNIDGRHVTTYDANGVLLQDFNVTTSKP